MAHKPIIVHPGQQVQRCKTHHGLYPPPPPPAYPMQAHAGTAWCLPTNTYHKDATLYDGSWSQFTHPIIAQFMQQYHQKRNQVKVTELLQAGGKKFIDLPKMQCFTGENGRSTLCYNYILGRCLQKECKFQHIKGTQLDLPFVQGMINVLTPGMQAVLARNLSAGQPDTAQSGGGQTSEKRKRGNDDGSNTQA